MTRKERVLAGAALGAFSLAFAYFVWPTPYEYYLGGPGNNRMLRRSRLAGEVIVISIRSESDRVDTTREAALVAIPAGELARLTGEAKWYRTSISVDLYNGSSAWRVREATVACELPPSPIDEARARLNKGSANPLRRTYVVKCFAPIEPFTRGKLYADTDTGPAADEKWTWSITAARGVREQ